MASCQGLDGINAGEQRLHRRRARALCRPAARRPRRWIPAPARTVSNNVSAPCSQLRERVGEIGDAVDAHGFEIEAQHGFDGAFPAAVDVELFGQSRRVGESALPQPGGDLACPAAQCGLLQGVQRGSRPRMSCSTPCASLSSRCWSRGLVAQAVDALHAALPARPAGFRTGAAARPPCRSIRRSRLRGGRCRTAVRSWAMRSMRCCIWFCCCSR